MLDIGSPYCDAEGSSKLRSYIQDVIINAFPRIGKKLEKLEFYWQFPPRYVKDKHITELERCECVWSLITIRSILKFEEKAMGNMGIFLVIDDGVYVCICKVYSSFFKKYTQHALVYDSNVSKL